MTLEITSDGSKKQRNYTRMNLEKWNMYAMTDLEVFGIIMVVCGISLVVAWILGAWWKSGNP